SGLVSVAADSTIRNLNTGGMTIQGQLTGENEASTLINDGVLYLRPFAVATEMMPIGTLDVVSNPTNWVIFGSGDKNQLLPGNVYQNLGIENNDKLMGGGDIEVKGDLLVAARVKPVDGTLDVFRFLLTGEADQTIIGSGLGSIENLEIAKASGKVVLGSDVEVSKLLVMSAGIIETGDYTLSLGTGGQLEESRNSYISGRVVTRRSVSAGSTRQFGGLGLKIRASGENALGETLVTRTTGSAYEPGMIERYFDIQPSNNANLGASVEFTYDERDLTGADEYDLYLEHLVSQDFFVTLDASKIDTATNVLSQDDIDAFGILTAKPTSIAVNAYPSPLRDDEDLNIEYVLQQNGIVHLVVFDRVGRAIYRDRFSGESGKQLFVMKELNLAPGVYYVRIKAGRQKGYKSFLKLPAN
ncbi:MAG: T9SS type A sorting domain-containing protein, partial [Bacteroidota bacterium]